MLVIIEITDPAFADTARSCPGGAYGKRRFTVKHFHHIGAMRKILLRMSAWID